jgi:hypothetical protein
MTTPIGGMPPPIDDELLSAYLDGQVSPDERGVVDAALAADPAVRARAADLRATVALLRALPQPAPRRTFILTPEQAATIRPVRVPWLTRLFPAVAVVSAVAAVLCLALIAGDLATGGFSTKKAVTTARPAIESVSDATATPVTSAAIAPTTAPAATTAAAPAAAAAPAPVNGASGSAASAGSAGAPAIGAAAIAPTVLGGTITALPPLTPTVGSFAANSGALPATPTIVANAQSSPIVLRAAPSGGATVTSETHRVPVALVRAGEILLALLAIAGIALAALGGRAKMRRT